MSLTSPQRNCLLAMYRAHPAIYEVRGAANLARRVADAGLAIQLARTPKTRRFRLTAAGLMRAEKLAQRRDADHGSAAAASGLAGACSSIQAPTSLPAGVPADWPFPVSAHAWGEPQAEARGL